MSAYLLLLACSCVGSAACAGFVQARASDGREGRLSAILLLGAAFWSACELAVGVSDQPAAALAWGRLSALGWVFIGPLVLDLLVRIDRAPTRISRLVPAAYAGGAGFLALAWFTPWMLAEPVRVGWSWGFVQGIAYPACYAFTLLCVAAGFPVMLRLFGSEAFEGERRQRPVVLAGMLVPLFAASLTDVVLPWLGYYPPRLGSTSFTILGLLAVGNILRFGYSVMTPGSFAEEILGSLRDGIALLRRDGRIRGANPALARLTGRSPEELLGLPLDEVLAVPLPRPLGEFGERDAEIVAVGGERVPVALGCRPMGDRLGHAVGLVVSVRDLREIESLRSGLASSARLASVGQLAAGIAHEINNPLAFVRANLNQLRGQWKAFHEGLDGLDGAGDLGERLAETEEIIQESLEGVERAAEIVRGVKGFSHAGFVARQPADVNSLLDQVMMMATPQLRGLASVERRFSELPRIRCAPQQLKQVFLNLLVNGAQAAGSGGNLRIVTQPERGGVRVEVRDDGCGMTPETRERVFDPFFTTKAVGEGTGLGLAIACQIVHAHGGDIQVESEPGVGSCFRVYLPAR